MVCFWLCFGDWCFGFVVGFFVWVFERSETTLFGAFFVAVFCWVLICFMYLFP